MCDLGQNLLLKSLTDFYNKNPEYKHILKNIINGKKIFLNYFDSNAENLAQKINRCMAMEYNTPDKKAHIYIVCSVEDVERKWLKKALEFFDKDKIKYT